jgi:hypothetical protein
LSEDGDELDGCLGEAIGCFLATAGVSAREQSVTHQALEAVGEDVGGDALLRAGL